MMKTLKIRSPSYCQYNVINCGHHVVQCIPMTYFATENCTFWCPLPVLPIFHPTSGNYQSVLRIHELGLLFVCFLGSTYPWDDNGIYLLLLIELETLKKFYWCIVDVVLVSSVQQSESVIHVFMLCKLLFPYRLLQNTEWSSQCFTLGPCGLSMIMGFPCSSVSKKSAAMQET